MSRRRVLAQWHTNGGGISDTSLVLEFNITSYNTPIVLGLANSYSCSVDWGDGSITNVVSSDANTRNHTYGIPGVYTVVATGSAQKLDFYGSSTPTTRGALRQCTYVGDLGWTSIYQAFKESNITGPLNADMFKYTSGVANFKKTFEKCYSLVGPLPAGLFDGAVNVGNEAFNATFRQCTALNGTIPVDFFKYNTNAQGSCFYETFSGCNNLTGDIPAGLFRPQHLIGAWSFYGTFLSCSKLRITPWIFYNDGEQSTRFAGKVLYVEYIFYGTGIGQPIIGTLPDLWNTVHSNNYRTYWRMEQTSSTVTNFAEAVARGW